MLEIGADKSNAGDLIKDVNEDTFMTDVIEASQEVRYCGFLGTLVWSV